MKLLYLAYAAGAAAVAYVLTRPTPGASGDDPTKPVNVIPPPAPPGAQPNAPYQPPHPPRVWLSDPLNLWQGHHYRAEVHLSPFTNMLASVSAVRKYAEGQGFVNVKVYTTYPDSWYPRLSAASQYFVEGDYAGQTRSMKRPVEILQATEENA